MTDTLPILLLVYGLLALPAGLLLRDWYRHRRLPPDQRNWFSPLTLATISYLWLIAGLVWASVLGPDYSNRRYAIINVNLIGSVSALCWAVVRRKFRSQVASVGLVLLTWFYVAAVNSVV